jgi:hypothetical protein
MTIKEIQEKSLNHTQTPPREPTIIVDGTKEEKSPSPSQATKRS